MAAKSKLSHRTYLLRAGRFSGARITVQRHNRPSTLVLWSTPPDGDSELKEEGDFYELIDGAFVFTEEDYDA